MRVASGLLFVGKGRRKVREVFRGVVGGKLSRKRGGVDVSLRRIRGGVQVRVGGRMYRIRGVGMSRIFRQFCGTSRTHDGASDNLNLSVTGRLMLHVSKGVDTQVRKGRFYIRVIFPGWGRGFVLGRIGVKGSFV